MSLWDGLVALGVILAFGYLVFIRLAKTNPVAAQNIRNMLPGKIYENEESPMPDKVQQVWEEKRTMM